MSDLYSEILIQRLPNPWDKLRRVALILLMVACVAGYLMVSRLFLFGIVGAGVLMWLIFPKFNVEYEYLLLNNHLDIDVIYSQKKRKTIAQYDLKGMELMAPYGSHRLDPYHGHPNLKMENYSAMDRNNLPYVMILRREGNPVEVLLQLDRETVENMKAFHPSKIFLD